MTDGAAYAAAPLAERLRAVATPARLDALIASACALGIAPARADALRAYAAAKVDGMAALARDLRAPDDETELFRLLAAFWIELRCEWRRTNDLLNYQIHHRGEADPHVVATAALVDGLVGWLEAAVPDGALGRLGSLALEFISRLQADVPDGAATLALPLPS